MPTESGFDKLLAYLRDPSGLPEGEVINIKKSLGSYEIDPHRQTAIKVMNSGVFFGDRFKQKTGEQGSPYIRNFEQFIARVAAAIDDHSNELEKCLDKGSRIKPNVSPNLAKRIDRYVKGFSPLQDELSQLKIIRSDSLAKIREMLEKLNEDVRERLSKKQSQPAKKKYWDKGKIPHNLVEKLIDIVKEHSSRTTNLHVARVIVKMLTKFDLKFTDNSIRIRKFKA